MSCGTSARRAGPHLVRDSHRGPGPVLLERVGVDRGSRFFPGRHIAAGPATLSLFVKRDRDCDVAIPLEFNGWAKYAHHVRRAVRGAGQASAAAVRVAPPVAAARRGGGAPTSRAQARQVVLEGGSIDVDGQGTLLTTEECLLSSQQARNPGLSRLDLERVLHDNLGATKVLWLGNGIAGDDTHGHVDDLARFVGPRTVVLAAEPDQHDPNHAALCGEPGTPVRETERRPPSWR